MAESCFFWILIDPTLTNRNPILRSLRRALAHMNVPKKGTNMFPSMVFSR